MSRTNPLWPVDRASTELRLAVEIIRKSSMAEHHKEEVLQLIANAGGHIYFHSDVVAEESEQYNRDPELYDSTWDIMGDAQEVRDSSNNIMANVRSIITRSKKYGVTQDKFIKVIF